MDRKVELGGPLHLSDSGTLAVSSKSRRTGCGAVFSQERNEERTDEVSSSVAAVKPCP